MGCAGIGTELPHQANLGASVKQGCLHGFPGLCLASHLASRPSFFITLLSYISKPCLPTCFSSPIKCSRMCLPASPTCLPFPLPTGYNPLEAYGVGRLLPKVASALGRLVTACHQLYGFSRVTSMMK